MSDLDTTVRLSHDVKLEAVCLAVSRLDNQCVLAFLKELDGLMCSWDFTMAAANLFTTEARKLGDEVETEDRNAINRIAEFARQAERMPNSEQLMGVWTDPNAQATTLTLSDLDRVLTLATVGLARTDG